MRFSKLSRYVSMTALFFSTMLLSSLAANAGVIEISYTYSQRSSFIDDDNYQKSLSHTGSLAWYFFDLSALELSYTNGEGEVSGKAEGENALKYITRLDMYDASLVVTIAQKDWSFQPYLKGGAAWVDKRIYRKDSIETKKISHTDKDEVVPSFGVGFKVYLTKGLSVRAGYDRWRTGKSGDEEVWDDAVRAGLSFNF